MLKEFREFIARGNAMDMAVGIIIGGAFGTVVKSLVDDVLMPPIGAVLGDVDFAQLFWVIQEGSPTGPYATLDAAREAGAVAVGYGVFINAVVTFLLVGFTVFLLVKGINRLRRAEEAETESEPETTDCPFCLTAIPTAATRCPACTSMLVDS